MEVAARLAVEAVELLVVAAEVTVVVTVAVDPPPHADTPAATKVTARTAASHLHSMTALAYPDGDLDHVVL